MSAGEPYTPSGRMQPPEELTLTAVGAEVMRARFKFPANAHLLAALMEEVGELAQAMLEGRPRDEIEKEAIQVACVAVRIVEEGDSDFVASVPAVPIFKPARVGEHR